MSRHAFWNSDELVIVMMGFLPLRRRLLLRRVCKPISRICRQRPPTAFDLSYTPPHLMPWVLDYIINEVGARAQWINLHGYGDDDIDAVLQRLCPACPGLQSLSVQFCWHLTDTGLRAIADHCPDMRTLSVWDCCGLTEPGFEYVLGKCRRLRTLDLRGLPQLTDSTMHRIAELPEITHLSLTGSGCTAAGFAHLLHTRKSGLRRIGCMMLRGGGPLVSPMITGERLVELQAMVECGARMTYIDVQEPYLWSYASLMPCLEHFTSLKQLNVTNPSEAFLCALSHCPRLQFLWVDRLQGNEGQWAALRGFPGLRYLYIGLMLQAPGALGLGGDNGQQANVGSDLIRVLQGTPRLRCLYLHRVSVLDADVAEVARTVPNLEVLDLINTPVTVECLGAVLSLRKLRQLYVPVDVYSDGEFSRALVAGLPSLQVYGPTLIRQEPEEVSFAAWAGGCRRRPAKGYNERDALKPPYTFVTTCDFEQDPVYNTTEV